MTRVLTTAAGEAYCFVSDFDPNARRTDWIATAASLAHFPARGPPLRLGVVGFSDVRRATHETPPAFRGDAIGHDTLQ